MTTTWERQVHNVGAEIALTTAALASCRAVEDTEPTMFSTASCAPRSLDPSEDTKEPVKVT
jgi:hypothetical protein